MRKGFLCNIQTGIPQRLIDHREEGWQQEESHITYKGASAISANKGGASATSLP